MKTKGLLATILTGFLLTTMMPLNIEKKTETKLINNKNQSERPTTLLACWNLLANYFNDELDLDIVGEDYTYKNIVAITTYTLQKKFGFNFFHHDYYPTDEEANATKDSDEIIMVMPANNDYSQHIAPVLGSKKPTKGYLAMKLVSRFGTKFFTLKLKNIIWHNDALNFKKWVNFIRNNPIPLNFLKVKKSAEIGNAVEKIKEKVLVGYKATRIFEVVFIPSVFSDIENAKVYAKENDKKKVVTSENIEVNVCPWSYEKTSTVLKFTFINSI